MSAGSEVQKGKCRKVSAGSEVQKLRYVQAPSHALCVPPGHRADPKWQAPHSARCLRGWMLQRFCAGSFASRGSTRFSAKALARDQPSSSAKKCSRECQKRSKTLPQRGPWSVLGHPGSTQGAPERCRGRLGGPKWAQEGATWANFGPTWCQLGLKRGST